MSDWKKSEMRLRETQTLKLSQLFIGAKHVSALLPLELDI
jgi:hypothetical protein